MWNLKVQVSKLDAPTELRLYVGALIPRDKTIFSQTPPACIMTTIQISTMINKSSKIDFPCTKFLILYFSNHLYGRWNKKQFRALSTSTIRHKETVKLHY